MNLAFWRLLDELVISSEVVIDRPQGGAHPRFPQNIYPHDSDYLAGTTSGDGQGIDVWLSSGWLENGNPCRATGVLCSADPHKRDAEPKLLLGCDPAEQTAIAAFLNRYPALQWLLLPRPSEET